MRANSHLQAQALYNAPTGIPPPVITGPMPGWQPENLGNLKPGEITRRSIERGFGSRENLSRDRWGRAIGAGIGGLLGLVGGGPGGAAALGSLGYRFGDNAARGIANLRRPDIGVPAITPPVQTPILQADTDGIFGQSRRMVGGAAQKILAAARSGKMPIEAAAKALGMPSDSLRDSLSSMGSAGRGGMGGMGQSWGGSYGGFYGGSPSGYASGSFHGGAYNPNR